MPPSVWPATNPWSWARGSPADVPYICSTCQARCCLPAVQSCGVQQGRASTRTVLGDPSFGPRADPHGARQCRHSPSFTFLFPVSLLMWVSPQPWNGDSGRKMGTELETPVSFRSGHRPLLYWVCPNPCALGSL